MIRLKLFLPFLDQCAKLQTISFMAHREVVIGSRMGTERKGEVEARPSIACVGVKLAWKQDLHKKCTCIEFRKEELVLC